MTFDLEYNSERSTLIIPEYGRHIQKLVNHCKTLPTKEERNTMALAIVDVMGNLQPHLRDVPDFKHKLWDQLFIMANFDLDVDAPYPKPSQEEFLEKPEPLAYPKSASKYRYYGHNIQNMIDVALGWDEGEMKEALVYTIANHMKKCYLNWNKDTVDDSTIFNHLYDLSDGKLDLRGSEEELTESKTFLKKRGGQGSSGSRSKKNSKNRKR
ncbi:MAG: methionyl-tRNA formyltransferase [Flavobacteriaceae bacterium]|nr:methionyl-tRNA formyltransferase [Flavobacteriaceae bacterium]|tara:strand:+ start:131520 stop:132152 length:633 start_codon:yes stop_codon:yes gene_type:complete